MDVDDPLLDRYDAIAHLMNGGCANHETLACAEVSQRVKSPVDMAIAVTKIIVDGHFRAQLSSEQLRTICSAVGIKPNCHQRESQSLIEKLRQRCKDLRPLSNCAGLESIFGEIEGLGKRSLRELAVQHQLSLPETQAGDVDDIRTRLTEHVSSGGCRASGSGLCVSVRGDYHETAFSDLETHVLQFASVKGNVSKKALKRILTCKGVEFDENGGINYLRKLLRSHVTQLRKGKQSQFSRNARSQEQRDHEEKLEGIRRNWPQPASMELKEQCIRNFRAATSSESLRQFTCACCAESVNVSERKVIPIQDINLDLMHNRTDKVFDSSHCTPPDLPFSDGPLANTVVDPDGVMYVNGDMSFQLCHRCASSLSRNKLPRLAIANLNVLGQVPSGMKAMTMVEEMLIARCRAKQCIVKLQDHRTDVSLPTSQRGFKGHVIVYPQKASELSDVLPPPVDDVVHPICVMFIGSTVPSQSWLKEKAYPLLVHQKRWHRVICRLSHLISIIS